MKIAIIGGTGRIGSRLAGILERQEHTVVIISRSTGVNTITGERLDTALSNVQTVVDVSNLPNAHPNAVLEFFDTSTRNVVVAEKRNGVSHHIILSIVGADRMQPKAYFRAKQAQERLVKDSGVPYTIVQATQFFEFLDNIANYGTKEGVIHLPAISFQPIAADDVAAILASVAVSDPLNGTVVIAGPEKEMMATIVGEYLKKKGDTRRVLSDPDADYFGIKVNKESLVPLAEDHQRIGQISLESWFSTQ